ncbi:MAG: hypothetical protein SO401_07115 [Blautia sp.]|nr:hypothetical protein [Blautia sp.]
MKKIKNIIIGLLFGTIVLCMPSYVFAEEEIQKTVNESLIWSNQKFGRAVCEQLGKEEGEIKRGDLQKIKMLQINGENLSLYEHVEDIRKELGEEDNVCGLLNCTPCQGHFELV